MSEQTRLYYVADLHGSERCFKKFINAARVYRANVLLIGGDFSSKTMTPVFEANGGWEATVDGREFRASSLSEIESLETELRVRATVPYRTRRDEWNELLHDRRAADDAFASRAREELQRWLTFATDRLRGSGARFLMGLGNDDVSSLEAVIADDPFAELTDREILAISPHYELVTLPYSNPTPWKTPRELPEEEIGRHLAASYAKVRDPRRVILNAHVPPVGTTLDLAPRLTANLEKVMAPGGEAELVHVGSTAVRACVEENQPLLGVHGHIHESRASATVGLSLLLNPGSAYTEGVLLGAVIDLDQDGIRSHVLTSG